MGVSQTVGGSSDVTIPALIKPWYAGVYSMLILDSAITIIKLLAYLILTSIFSTNMKYRGSDIYPPVSPYDMMNQIGASPPPADTNGGTTGGLAMGASDPVVAGYNKSSGVVNLLHARALLHALKRPNHSHRAFLSHSFCVTCIISVALLIICLLYIYVI